MRAFLKTEQEETQPRSATMLEAQVCLHFASDNSSHKYVMTCKSVSGQQFSLTRAKDARRLKWASTQLRAVLVSSLREKANSERVNDVS